MTEWKANDRSARKRYTVLGVTCREEACSERHVCSCIVRVLKGDEWRVCDRPTECVEERSCKGCHNDKAGMGETSSLMVESHKQHSGCDRFSKMVRSEKPWGS